MNEELLEKIRESRKIEVRVGGITFRGECLQYAKLLKVINSNGATSDLPADAVIAFKSITGWEGMTEADIINGGDADNPVQFSQNLFEDLIFDRSDWWTPISQAVVESVQNRQAKKESEIKNSKAGTKNKTLEE